MEAYCTANFREGYCPARARYPVEDAGEGGTEIDSRTSLDRLVTVVKEHGLPGLNALAFAHCLQSGKTLKVGNTDIRYVEPHRIEHDELVRVVIFKMALTTGWDCPRAEVMMSFRKADDATYIAQLVGRIVRTPLARRMEGNDLLNSVMLFLPYFDRKQVQSVIERLEAEGESGGSETGDEGDFQTLKVAKDKEDLLAVYRMLPTYATQEGRKVAHIRRALRFALELAKDGWDSDARAMRDGLRATLVKIGDARRNDPAFTNQIQNIYTNILNRYGSRTAC
jgi:type III restriction enzyme